ncbi:MAG: type VI secretion system contractile sheath large subunit, partial [Tolumonas sp.]|nr:type VI secretion system contractile sheath large subunit [Tolumonas sp.]
MNTGLQEQSAVTLASGNILDRIIAETKLTPQDEAYDIAKRGVSAFIEELLKSKSSAEPVKKALVDKMIAAIDEKLSRQVDAVLHHEKFQQLESAWRGLKL